MHLLLGKGADCVRDFTNLLRKLAALAGKGLVVQLPGEELEKHRLAFDRNHRDVAQRRYLADATALSALAERPVVEKHPAVERGKSLFLRGILGGSGRLASSGKVLDHGLEDAALAIDVVVVLRRGYERAEYDDATLPEFACRADDIVAALHEHPAERPDLQHHVVEASEHERLVPERLGDSAVAVAPEPRRANAVVRRRDLRESLVSASPDSAAAERAEEHAAAARRKPHHLPRGRAGREVSVVPAARKHDDVRALVRLRLFKDFRIALYLLQLVPCILNGSLEHG